MTHVSLFSGIGGIDLAAHWAGFETVAFVERDAYCQKVLAKNFPGVPIYDDVCTVTADRLGLRSPLTLLSGGFPCQPHSFAGARRASGDERDLWGECVRLISELRPRWFLGENVAGLLASERGRFFGRIIDDLACVGYRVGWASYGAGHIGAGHRRLRVFLVAHPDDIRCAWLPESKREPEPGRTELNHSALLDGARRVPTTAKRLGVAVGKQIGSFADRAGIDDGLSAAVDRTRALGNAVVPQQVFPILQAIAQAINQGSYPESGSGAPVSPPPLTRP